MDGLAYIISNTSTAHSRQRNTGYPGNSGYARVHKDFYVEPRWVVEALLDVESFVGAILDPCCGSGTIPSVCLSRGLPTTDSDIVNRGFGQVRDLFDIVDPVDNIISNVPNGIAERCARHMITLARHKVALILPMFANTRPFATGHAATARRCRPA
jgi:hypothetical protein